VVRDRRELRRVVLNRQQVAHSVLACPEPAAAEAAGQPGASQLSVPLVEF
jgi:hypothetical protein